MKVLGVGKGPCLDLAASLPCSPGPAALPRAGGEGPWLFEARQSRPTSVDHLGPRPLVGTAVAGGPAVLRTRLTEQLLPALVTDTLVLPLVSQLGLGGWQEQGAL